MSLSESRGGDPTGFAGEVGRSPVGSNRSGAVGKAVRPAVDRVRMDGAPRIVHSFGIRRPPGDPQLALTSHAAIFNVTVAGYEPVHTVHSPNSYYY